MRLLLLVLATGGTTHGSRLLPSPCSSQLSSLCTGHSRPMSRRQAGLTAALACAFVSLPELAAADTPQAEPLQAERPKVTQRVQLDIAIGTGDARSLVIGLYGDEAPASVSVFRALCSNCVPGASVDLGYRGSLASRVERDKQIVLGRPPAGAGQVIERSLDNTGYVRSELINLAEKYVNSDDNSLSHDRAGLVSMRRGGGEFEFVLTPATNPGLDASRIVIGEVLQGSELVAALNAVPARKPAKDNELGALMAAVGAYDESRYAAVAKAGGDPRSRIETTYRPLQKIKIVSCSLE